MEALGRYEYREALDRQLELVARRERGVIPDLVWFLEHPPVVTWSRSRGRDQLRAPAEAFEAAGVAIEETDRGGDATYHGPGQLVAYPIVDLGAAAEPAIEPALPALGRDLHKYLRALEEAIIECVAGWGIRGQRVAGRTGVWVGDAKLAAIGVRARRWVMFHGLALNVRCDMMPFRKLIVPCGIVDKGVTSLAELLGDARAPLAGELVGPLHRALERALGRRLSVTFDGREILAPGPP
jgi:lipoate-protein ligase B